MVRFQGRGFHMAKRSFNDNDYQEHYRLNYASAGHTYMQTRPAYLFGWEMASEQRFHERPFDARTERDLRWGWEQRAPRLRWDDARNAIHEGWNRARGIGRPRPLGSGTYSVAFRDREE
jgi:hypothetical protein